MIRFLKRYLVTALLGSAAVYVGIPYARPYLQAWRGDAAGMRSDFGLAALSWKELTALIDELPFGREQNRDDIALDTAIMPLAAPVPASPPQPPPEGTLRHGEAAETPPPAPHTLSPTDTTLPASLPATPAGSWGVTREAVKAYDLSGKFTAYVPGGTLVQTDGRSAKGPNGRLYVCRMLLDGRWSSDRLLGASDLLLRPGAVSDAPPSEREMLQRYGRTQGEIAERERRLKQQALDANPHAPAYRQSLAAYRTFIAKVKELTAKRDAATGSDHVRYSDQLQALKPQGVRLGRDFEQSKAKYLAWSEAHPTRVDPQRDPQIQRLQQELAQLEQQVREL